MSRELPHCLTEITPVSRHHHPLLQVMALIKCRSLPAAAYRICRNSLVHFKRMDRKALQGSWSVRRTLSHDSSHALIRFESCCSTCVLIPSHDQSHELDPVVHGSGGLCGLFDRQSRNYYWSMFLFFLSFASLQSQAGEKREMLKQKFMGTATPANPSPHHLILQPHNPLTQSFSSVCQGPSYYSRRALMQSSSFFPHQNRLCARFGCKTKQKEGA